MDVVVIAPQIPGNFGAIMRSCANFAAPLHAVDPLGFPLDRKALRRAAMDYAAHVDIVRHTSFESYLAENAGKRRILLTTSGTTALPDFVFRAGDHLLFGNEGSGAPPDAHDSADARLRIPGQGRSLNLSVSVAITLFEALRQTGGLPNAQT